VALIGTTTWAATGEVEAENVALVWPAGTVTEGGIPATGVPPESTIIAPPVPAGPLSATVPVDATPPVTAVGTKLSEVRARGLTVSVADFEVEPNVAVIVADTWLTTVVVAMLVVAEEPPAGMVTLAGA